MGTLQLLSSNSPQDITATFVGSSAGGSNTVTLPAGWRSGDLLLVWNVAYNATATIPTSVVPGGSTSYYIGSGSVVSGGGQQQLFYSKILTLSDSTFAAMTATYQKWIAVVFRMNTSYTRSVTSFGGECTDLTPATRTIAVTGLAAPTISLVMYGATSTITSRTSSITMNEISWDVGTYLKYAINNGSPATSNITASMPDSGIGNWMASACVQLI